MSEAISVSVRPKPGFGIGNRNQDQVSVSVLVCLNLNFPPFEKYTKNHFSYYLKDKEKHLDSQNDKQI